MTAHDSHHDSSDSLSPAAGRLISLSDEEDNEGEEPRERWEKREKEKVDSSVSCTTHVAEPRTH